MRKVFFFVIFFFFFLVSCFLLVPQALAVCPVCTVAVGAGVGLSRYLGVDDAVSGVWIGGFIISSGLWLSNWLAKKNVRVRYRPLLSTILMFVLVVPPLFWTGIAGHKLNTWWGIDKLLLGIIVGSILFIFAVFTDKVLRYTNNHKVKFYYQKVILPVLFLLAASVVLYLVTKR